ncbi:MAG: DUF4397 domain-containing protein [Chitinophagaceae bacterium]|nr:DUF4397 domain-containing protein [Chitinophagaceae bacterium]
MKNLNITISVAGLLFSAAVLSGCTKTFDEKVSQQRNFSNSSLLQLYNATVGTSRNYIYVDSKPLNGAAIAYGGIFPGTGYGFAVPIGLKNFLIRDTLSTSTQSQLSFAENLQSGRNYTIFMYDTSTATKQKTVETALVIPADTTARIRFANFVYNPGIIPAVDVYSQNRKQNIFTNIAVTDVTSFIPYASGQTDTFYIRSTGTNTNLQNLVPTPAPGTWTDIRVILTPTQKRSYTIIFRGGYRATTSTNATVRTLAAFPNN